MSDAPSPKAKLNTPNTHDLNPQDELLASEDVCDAASTSSSHSSVAPHDPLKKLLASNRQWSTQRVSEDPEYFKRLLQQQSPDYLWIGCSDSRVPANVILGLDPGEVFVQRNVGNQATHCDLNCMSCLEYSVKELKVKTVVVCGHYGCGAVKAALQLPSKTQGLVNCWISDIRECRNQHRDELMGYVDLTSQVDRLCELNVLRQAFHVCTSPVVQAAWDQGQEVRVYGLIYSLKDGLIKKLAGPITQIDDFEHMDAFEAQGASFVGGANGQPPISLSSAPSCPIPGRGAPKTSLGQVLIDEGAPLLALGTTPRTAKAQMDEFHAYINTKKFTKKMAEHVGWSSNTPGFK